MRENAEPVPLDFGKRCAVDRRHDQAGALGADGQGLTKIRVTLHETDLARASFESGLG